MNRRFLILDCFVDEPACFGVPPFLSPYPRYIFGALLDAGSPPENIYYLTIEQVRNTGFKLTDEFELVFLIGGAVVPGKYLGYRIGTSAEISRVFRVNPNQQFVAGGMVSRHFPADCYNNCRMITGDPEKFAYSYLQGRPIDDRRDYAELSRWATAGMEMVSRHPCYPNIICEIETYRGCPRQLHCSFCIESFFGKVEFRKSEHILNEIDLLILKGISRFRLGRQADILQYNSTMKDYKHGHPRPSIEHVTSLFKELKNRRQAGAIKTLNVDNANPGTIYHFPDESSEILEALTDAVSPGDTLALGIESFDPEVIIRNNLKTGAEETLFVTSLINQIGGKLINGIPALLPGINLIHGLSGESIHTFRINYESLHELMEKGILIRRINIRKALPFPGTELYRLYKTPSQKVKHRYEFYKNKIRKEIDQAMLRKIFPTGSILKDLLVMEKHFEYSLAKQIASYSITAKIPVSMDMGSFIDAIVVDHRERSVLALPYPVKINQLPGKALELIPGIGKRTASHIILERPFKSLEELLATTPDIPKTITENMTFSD